VEVWIPATNCNHLEILWAGKIGGYYRPIPLASVFALSDGDTGYIVRGVGRVGDNKEADLAAIKIWQRYVGVFTPHRPPIRFEASFIKRYRVSKDGVSSDGNVYPGVAHPIFAGCWWTMPTANRPDWNRWLHGWGDEFKTYPKYLARSRRFANDLRKRLAGGPTAVVQLLNRTEGNRFHGREGLQLHVCLPPTRTQQGKRLIIQGSMHDLESRHFHHVDGDYGPRHSQYFAWLQGDPKEKVMRWKCSKDALNGIVEWVLGSIYIPGPEN
jgi:hypothetical protein